MKVPHPLLFLCSSYPEWNGSIPNFRDEMIYAACLIRWMELFYFLFSWRYEEGAIIKLVCTITWVLLVGHPILLFLYPSFVGHGSFFSYAANLPPSRLTISPSTCRLRFAPTPQATDE